MKLGGSVLTDKTRYATARPDVIARLAKELASAPGPLVIVHGAGSFGHVLAREHRLAEGDDGDMARRRAFARLLADVRRLDAMLCDALLDAGVMALPIPTFALGRTLKGDILHFPSHALRKWLLMGYTPVVPGDGVPDAFRKFGILGGDPLMLALAREMRPSRVLFVTNVDGVFDRDPLDAHARLLPTVAAHDAPEAGDAVAPDVTGGMGAKLGYAREIARLGLRVEMVNGLAPGRVADALHGRPTVGTVVS